MFALSSLGALALAASAAPQVGGGWTTHQHHTGNETRAYYGCAVAFLDDLTGDGKPEYLIGARDESNGTGIPDGYAEVRDGATGLILYSFLGPATEGGRLGTAVAALPDIDGDGTGDFAISAPFGHGSVDRIGLIHAYSGANGSLIWTAEGEQTWSEFGSVMHAIGDVTGDGVGDLLVGCPDWTRRYLELWTGAAYILSGTDGSLFRRQIGHAQSDYYGQAVGPIGDVDGDGTEDFAISRRGPDLDTPGFLEIHSGVDMRRLQVIAGPTPEIFNLYQFGNDFCSLGDLDGDGADEFAVALSAWDNLPWHNTGGVIVYRGRNGKKLWEFKSDFQYGYAGSAIARIGDLNGDGHDELAVGEPGNFQGGRIHVLSGIDGRTLTIYQSPKERDEFGAILDAGADTDGDGIPEILAGAWDDDVLQPGAGQAAILEWDPFVRADQQLASNSTSGTVTLSVGFPASEAGLEYGLLLSGTGTGPTLLNGQLVPLSIDQLFQRTRRLSPPPGFTGANGSLNAQAEAAISFSWSPGRFTGEVGLTYWACVVTRDAAGIREVSAAVPLFIAP